MKALHSFEMFETTNPTKRHHITDYFDVSLLLCGSVHTLAILCPRKSCWHSFNRMDGFTPKLVWMV